MKRILVPTDFSVCADYAADVAILMARQSRSAIYFLHLAVDPSGPSHVPGKQDAKIHPAIGHARYQMEQLLKNAEEQGVDAKAEFVLGSGQEEIEDYIKPLAIDWLVMGSHGATGIREAIIGSKTQHVIRNIQIPSLVVKRPLNQSALRNILFASNFKVDVFHALKPSVEFAKLWDGSLHLLFINLLNHLIEEKVARLMMSKQVEKFPGTNYTLNITETNDKEFGIAKFAEQIGADVIAVPIESHTVVGRLFNPDLAEKLINHSQLPVLVAHL